jgi:hypothetical protein
VIREHSAWELAGAELLLPFRPTARFQPMPRIAHLVRLRNRWKRMPGGAARLKFVAGEIGSLGLRLDELRLAPSTIRLPGWVEIEEAVSVIWRAVIVSCGMPIVESHVGLVIVGLHGLARYYERARVDDAAVTAELHRLATMHHELIGRASPELHIPSGKGVWRGRRVTMAGQPVVALRTFIPSEL